MCLGLCLVGSKAYGSAGTIKIKALLSQENKSVGEGRGTMKRSAWAIVFAPCDTFLASFSRVLLRPKKCRSRGKKLAGKKSNVLPRNEKAFLSLCCLDTTAHLQAAHSTCSASCSVWLALPCFLLRRLPHRLQRVEGRKCCCCGGSFCAPPPLFFSVLLRFLHPQETRRRQQHHQYRHHDDQQRAALQGTA